MHVVLSGPSMSIADASWPSMVLGFGFDETHRSEVWASKFYTYPLNHSICVASDCKFMTLRHLLEELGVQAIMNRSHSSFAQSSRKLSLLHSFSYCPTTLLHCAFVHCHSCHLVVFWQISPSRVGTSGSFADQSYLET